MRSDDGRPAGSAGEGRATGPAAPDRPAGWAALAGRDMLPWVALTSIGVWLHAADELLVATMSPAILADIGGAALIAWTISLYELGSIAAGAAAAILALRHGLRPTMAGAAAIYALGCSVSALAPSMEVLLAGRLMQGVGGGGMMALSFVAVGVLFPPAHMPRVMAVISTLWGVSAFVGPLVGGLFAEAGFWRGAFWFFALQAALLAGLIRASLPGGIGADPSAAEGSFPLGRLALLAAAVLAIATAGVVGDPALAVILVAAGLGALGLFLVRDARRAGDRLLARRALDPRTGVGAALLMVLLLAASTIVLAIYGPLVLVRLHGLSAIEAGYVLALASISWSVAAVLVAGRPEAEDARLILAGMAAVVAAVAVYAVWGVSGPVWLIATATAVEGAGFGLAWTFILRRATRLAAADDRERLASALPTVQRLGYALGAAYAGIVANAAGVGDAMDDATLAGAGRAVFLAALPLALAGLAAAVLFVRAAPPPATA